MKTFPFLRPNLVRLERYASYLLEIESSRIYSNYGPLNTRFEKRLIVELFKNTGALTTVANATLGLMIAYTHFRRPGGRYALMPSFTFSATAQAAVWAGLTPYFVDIDAATWSMDQDLLQKTIKQLGAEVALIAPYATFGSAIEISSYEALHRSGLPVIIDAAASIGTEWDGTHFGANFPGAVVFSMHATKAFPIGEGGLIYSSDTEAIRKMREAANFGFTNARESVQIGLNAKLSELHAAIGLATLDEFASRKLVRQTIYDWYQQLFTEYRLLDKGWLFQRSHGAIAHQFVPALCPTSLTGRTAIDFLNRSSIEARSYFYPTCHQQPFFAASPRTDMSVTETIASRIISLPLWEDMTYANVKTVVETLASL